MLNRIPLSLILLDYKALKQPRFVRFKLFCGCIIFIVQIATPYGVKLSPSFLVLSNWEGCLGVMNNYESLLPKQESFVWYSCGEYCKCVFDFISSCCYWICDNALWVVYIVPSSNALHFSDTYFYSKKEWEMKLH